MSRTTRPGRRLFAGLLAAALGVTPDALMVPAAEAEAKPKRKGKK